MTGLTQLTGPISIGLAGVAVCLAAYFGYPYFEEHVLKKIDGYVRWITETQEKMFQPVKAFSVILLLMISTALFTYLGYVFSQGYGVITFFFTALAAFLGWSIPRWWVSFRWERRLRLFNEQLVDALNLMANSIKSGLNLPKVIQVLVQEMPNPISQEFGVVLSQQKIGLTIDEALEKMLDRVPTDDLGVAIHSVLILRETGGDLAETFDTIATTIRERRKVDGKIKALTQQGRTQGLILFLMPFGLAGMLYIMNPEFILPLVTTRLGWMMIIVMFFFQIIGGLWIRKVVTIDV